MLLDRGSCISVNAMICTWKMIYMYSSFQLLQPRFCIAPGILITKTINHSKKRSVTKTMLLFFCMQKGGSNGSSVERLLPSLSSFLKNMGELGNQLKCNRPKCVCFDWNASRQTMQYPGLLWNLCSKIARHTFLPQQITKLRHSWLQSLASPMLLPKMLGRELHSSFYFTLTLPFPTL